ncbi:rhamnosyltransferase WsaF family glycosyltransferase [Mesorhizobium sp. NBSH29]|uniref:rhamnosyltransferase WsaF family glycosyltransferase n=1 Tax=Mesorhizobium sp. NBSH29 TaxID=2654249 RepID=UPI0018969623|nr:rhamnan synthesis F family protein [Mesorhizobium sp. NBSH29]
MQPEASPGSLNAIGAVIARLPPPGWNTPVSIPLATTTDSTFERVAVVAHIFYPDLADGMLSYLDNIPVPYGLFISTDSEDKRKQISEAASRLTKPVELEIRVVPNVGRDIAPKYIAFRDIYSRYPAFVHIHSKKSPHAGDTYKNWRSYLLSHLLGSKDIVRSNLHLLSQGRIGVVYPKHADVVRNVINWGYDFDIAATLLDRIGIKLNADMVLEFPSGSMYWGRSAAISKILDLDLQVSDFPPEEGQVDGTLAHAIERALLIFVEASGHQWVRTEKARDDKAGAGVCPPFQPILASPPLPSRTEMISTDTLPISVTPVHRPHRRFNLLVPTINATQTFGGIDTALKLFTELSDAEPNSDFRVVVTDSAATEGVPARLDGFTLQQLGGEQPGRKIALDCSKRRTGQTLEVAANDVFIATAWWTAHNAFKIQEQQRVLFGSAPRVVYLIQDFEPGFYAWSSRYALADATYRKPEDTIAIFNSEELESYMSKHYALATKSVLRYEPNRKVAEALQPVPRERIILFYSRPSAIRNCFEIGIDALTLWQKRNPVLASKWQIFCIGEAFPPHLAGPLANVEVTGKMPLDEYAGMLSRASVGLSLMVSPHPSYPPLEMAFAGVKTLTNNYECKNMALRSPNITSVDEVSVNALACELERMIALAEANIGKVTDIRCAVKHIETSTSTYRAADLLAALDNPRDRGLRDRAATT